MFANRALRPATLLEAEKDVYSESFKNYVEMATKKQEKHDVPQTRQRMEKLISSHARAQENITKLLTDRKKSKKFQKYTDSPSKPTIIHDQEGSPPKLEVKANNIIG